MNEEEIKSCCADAYAKDVVALLLGESYHPGGTRLTLRLADRLGLAPGMRVLDVASGRGTTALLLADRYQVRADGVDYAPTGVALAREAAEAAGLADRVSFTTGDAERLPYGDAVFDAVVCECSLCVFPDKARAAGEFARVLKPGGRVGVTDVIARPDRLPPELRGLGARIACVADARPQSAYTAILAAAGLRTVATERHDRAMVRLIDQIEARLALVRRTAPTRLAASGVDPASARDVLDAARAAVAGGDLGYLLLTAVRPARPATTAGARPPDGGALRSCEGGGGTPARPPDGPEGASPLRQCGPARGTPPLRPQETSPPGRGP
ncbi:methyltransferase domain-containing protein [Streptomyces sp. NBC_01216]|uniref:class I SAM-dependent methyltransferase n=1 Tax=Streptomyces sp. NBC_01216 TaxID=2903778 RepID=UPI002E14F14F|nr:methyltransferase domain-containing protein [Streptomyces sp. NBC_01216]